MVDWKKPVQVFVHGEWCDAEHLIVSAVQVYAAIIGRDGKGLAFAELCHCKDDVHVRNTPPAPTWRAWKDFSEMGGAVEHWFKKKIGIDARKIVSVNIDCVNVYGSICDLGELFDKYEHSPTPWIESSWMPCGERVEA